MALATLTSDGRCASKQQAKRDEDAQFHSYWPTTLRVDADMDSFWLKDEERTCETYPDANGRVAGIASHVWKLNALFLEPF